MKRPYLIVAAGLLAAFSIARAPAQVEVELDSPPAAEWPSWHGDYSGRHFSSLRQITNANVARIGLAWTVRLDTSTKGAVSGGLSSAGASAPVARAGEDEPAFPTQLKSIPVTIDGVLYLTAGSQAFALDARSGALIWHYHWQSPTGASLGRGVAVLNDLVYVQTGSDNWIVALDRKSGHERWRHQVTPSVAGIGGTTAPMIAGGHLIVGMGGDGNNLGPWLESRDPKTGALQWKWFVAPDDNDPAIRTWPSADAARHGGGMPWQQVTYDPGLDLIYVPTANPVPVFNGLVRPGDNLYTNCIVALHAKTGKLAWYFQTTPHDTHDYDATQVAILFDGTIHGRPRKLLAQFNRAGYFFVLDRATGEHIVTEPFVKGVNWAKGVNGKGQPIPDPAKEPQPGGVLLSPMSDGAANYPAPAFSPQTGLVYSQAHNSWSIMYRHPEEPDPIGWGGGSEYHTGYTTSALIALDYATGRAKWSHAWPGTGFVSSTYPGVLVTAGGLLFTGDPAGNFVAFNAADGHILWHSHVGGITNAPITYQLDGRQYVLVSTAESLFAFALNSSTE